MTNNDQVADLYAGRVFQKVAEASPRPVSVNPVNNSPGTVSLMCEIVAGFSTKPGPAT